MVQSPEWQSVAEVSHSLMQGVRVFMTDDSLASILSRWSPQSGPVLFSLFLSLAESAGPVVGPADHSYSYSVNMYTNTWL